MGRGGGYKAPDGATIPTVSPSATGETGAVQLWKQDVRFFMPRIGIAYRPSDKWVFRIGGGMFDNINHLNNLYHSEPDATEVRQPHLHVGDRRLAQRYPWLVPMESPTRCRLASIVLVSPF